MCDHCEGMKYCECCHADVACDCCAIHGSAQAMSLLRAAPDMLAALELAEALEAGDVHPADTRWKDARKMRHAAIKAARGEK